MLQLTANPLRGLFAAELGRFTHRRLMQEITENGNRKWATFDDLDLNSANFLEIGKAYEEGEYEFSKGRVGYAESTLVPQRVFVDFAVNWMENHRT